VSWAAARRNSRRPAASLVRKASFLLGALERLQWRICLAWPDKSPGPTNVEIVDYH
jgi:hypothetical protein